MLYFYAPSYHFLGPRGGDCYAPGAQVDDEIAEAELPAGSYSPHYDSDLPRFVLVCPADTPRQGGWEERTPEQVNADYPGTVGGA